MTRAHQKSRLLSALGAGLGLAVVAAGTLVAAPAASAAPAYSVVNTTTGPDTSTTGPVAPTETPAPEETSAPDATVTPAPEATGTPAPEDAGAPAPEDTGAPAPEDTVAPAPEATPAPGETTPSEDADAAYSITGVVTAKDRKATFVPTVELNENDGYSPTTLTLDSTGKFTFSELRPNPKVTLTFSADGYGTISKDVNISAADATVDVELLPFMTKVGAAKITGTPEVGKTLTGTTTGWPAGTQLSYQWGFNGGQFGGAIEGATGTTLKLTKDLIGTQIVFIVTGTKDGYAPTDVAAYGPHVTAAKKAAAPAPAGDSGGLAVYLKERGVTPQSQASVGLPDGALNPGEDYTAKVAWTAADSFVDVYLYSTPTFVGTFPVVDGVTQITLSEEVLSELEAGNHTLVVTGQTSGAVQAVALTVAPMLAATGFNGAAPLAVAVILVLLGAALLVVRRRRMHA